MPTICRHLPVFRRCLGAESVLLVAGVPAPTGRGPDRSPRLYLDAPPHELSDVRWARTPC